MEVCPTGAIRGSASRRSWARGRTPSAGRCAWAPPS
ncbi:MAG: hypothetical protein ACR2RB_21740, partial [Gammaproteobacteria bacterium]